MNRPPDDYYNSPTENGSYPPQQRPGYPQQPSLPNYPPQQNFPPNPGPMSQPGFPPQQNFPPNPGPMSQPGFSPQQNFPPNPGPISQPGFSPQQNFPPNPGPMSQPGFSQQPASYPQQASWPGNFAPTQDYPGQSPQQNFPSPQWQGQYNTHPGGPNLLPPEEPGKSKKGLIAIISIVLVLLIVVGGAGAYLVLGRQSGNHTPSSSTTSNTPVTTHPTPGVTQPGGNTPSGSGQPTQAGSIWVVTITHATTSTSSQFPPSANDTYLEISMTLKNVSATAQPVSSLIQFSLTGTDGAKYTESLTDTNVHQTPDASVNAGQTLNAQLAYQVPKSKHAFILSFAYGLINGSNASISWQINV